MEKAGVGVQTWFKSWFLSRTNGVILSKLLITLSLGVLIYQGRGQASFIQSLLNIYYLLGTWCWAFLGNQALPQRTQPRGKKSSSDSGGDGRKPYGLREPTGGTLTRLVYLAEKAGGQEKRAGTRSAGPQELAFESAVRILPDQ